MSNLTGISPYSPADNVLFNPNQVSSCSVWLDGQDRNSMTFSGNNVTLWRDKSGNNNNATATGNISNTTAINGKFAMTYPGVTNTFFRGPMVNTTSGSVTGFAVFNMLATSFTSIRVISLGISTAVDFNNSLYTALIERATGGIDSYRAGSSKSTRAYTLGTPAIACSIYDGASNYMFVNGNAGTPVASSGNFGYSNYQIGSEFGEDTVPIVQYSGSIGEIIMFNRISLNTSQRQQVEGYLAWKWGLQGSLPSTHPYYNNPYLPNSYPISYYPPRMSESSTVPSVPGFTIPTIIKQYVYSPNTLSNLSLWLDASDASTLFQDTAGTIPITGNNQSVALWRDKSSNANVISNSTNTPTISFNSVNTLNAVNFNGSQYLNISNTTLLPNGSSNFSYFAVTLTSNSGVQVFLSYGANPNNTNQDLQVYYGSYRLFSDTYGAGGIGDNTTLNNVFNIISGTLTNTNSGWVNGNSFSGTNNTPITLNIGTGYGTIGVGRVVTTLSYYFYGKICEILVYNQGLSTDDRQEIEGYLAWKWNLQKSLPISHPYYYFPPG